MSKNKGNFLKVQNALLDHLGELGLSPEDYTFICLIKRFDYGNGKPYPSFARMAEMIGKDERTLRRWADSIVAKGYPIKEARSRFNTVCFNLSSIDKAIERLEANPDRFARNKEGSTPGKSVRVGKSTPDKSVKQLRTYLSKDSGQICPTNKTYEEDSKNNTQHTHTEGGNYHHSSDSKGHQSVAVDDVLKEEGNTFTTQNPAQNLILELTRAGVTEIVARRLAQGHSAESIRAAIAYCDTPGGVVTALKDGWDMTRTPKSKSKGCCPVCGKSGQPFHYSPTSVTQGADPGHIGRLFNKYPCGHLMEILK